MSKYELVIIQQPLGARETSKAKNQASTLTDIGPTLSYSRSDAIFPPPVLKVQFNGIDQVKPQPMKSEEFFPLTSSDNRQIIEILANPCAFDRNTISSTFLVVVGALPCSELGHPLVSAIDSNCLGGNSVLSGTHFTLPLRKTGTAKRENDFRKVGAIIFPFENLHTPKCGKYRLVFSLYQKSMDGPIVYCDKVVSWPFSVVMKENFECPKLIGPLMKFIRKYCINVKCNSGNKTNKRRVHGKASNDEGAFPIPCNKGPQPKRAKVSKMDNDNNNRDRDHIKAQESKKPDKPLDQSYSKLEKNTYSFNDVSYSIEASELETTNDPQFKVYQQLGTCFSTPNSTDKDPDAPVGHKDGFKISNDKYKDNNSHVKYTIDSIDLAYFVQDYSYQS
ncbi:hypothetical protein DASC09_053110 [Saccharomycopsis crataegensis]|uniref:Velvet domain-containing protein n=1 Tax=Saccharomycopsis crataegensis TaxID=43959 RepID=A0AAV5QTZ7_9ASCO|nr:hypothetical protein DASC09_053110 [Saccharomycopsis crataegensis]